MSQSKRNNTPAGQANSLPGLISAAVVIIVLGLIALLLFNRSNTQPAAQSPAAETALPLPTSPAPPISPVPGSQADSPAYSSPPPMTIDPAKSYTATITTPRGEIVIRLRPDIAPQTVNNFVFLAREGFYNGLTWHRVIEGFMAQGGDPLGDGTGGPGYTIPAEFTEQIFFDRPGIVATARRSDTTDSNGSQFFITTAPAPHLNAQYTIFGEVVSGQEIVDAIPLRDPLTTGTPGEQILQITVTEG